MGEGVPTLEGRGTCLGRENVYLPLVPPISPYHTTTDSVDRQTPVKTVPFSRTMYVGGNH